MRQSNVIFGTLVFAFIVYITVRGQLPGYLNLFRHKENSSVPRGLGSNISINSVPSGLGSNISIGSPVDAGLGSNISIGSNPASL